MTDDLQHKTTMPRWLAELIRAGDELRRRGEALAAAPVERAADAAWRLRQQAETWEILASQAKAEGTDV